MKKLKNGISYNFLTDDKTTKPNLNTNDNNTTKKYVHWGSQHDEVIQPDDNDVLYGLGGLINITRETSAIVK